MAHQARHNSSVSEPPLQQCDQTLHKAAKTPEPAHRPAWTKEFQVTASADAPAVPRQRPAVRLLYMCAERYAQVTTSSDTIVNVRSLEPMDIPSRHVHDNRQNHAARCRTERTMLAACGVATHTAAVHPALDPQHYGLSYRERDFSRQVSSERGPSEVLRIVFTRCHNADFFRAVCRRRGASCGLSR